MSKKLYVVASVCAACVGGYVLVNHYQNSRWLAKTDSGIYKPYILGTKIGFKTGENSTNFVKAKDGWGAPSDNFTFTIGRDTTMNLFIKNGVNENLRVDLVGFGLYPKDKEYQEMDVYANGTKITTMHMSEKQEYTIRIPASVMQTEELSLKFHFDKPYKSKKHKNIVFGISVEEITVKKDYLIETKRSIHNWLKKQQ